MEQRRTALLGFTLGVYRAGDILAAALSVFDASGVEILLIDESAPADEQLLASYPHPLGLRVRTSRQLKRRRSAAAVCADR